jgi:uncharacterized membrane protein
MTNDRPQRTSNLNISESEYQLILSLRDRNPSQATLNLTTTKGDQLADKISSIVGSWRFVMIQSSLLTLWIILNLTAFIQHWDPYPFILLNLALSFQAAYTAPIIMMSQNRQSIIDRQTANHDYEIDLKAELEIELLHDAIALLKQEELNDILSLLRSQQVQLETQQELNDILSLLRSQQAQLEILSEKLSKH